MYIYLGMRVNKYVFALALAVDFGTDTLVSLAQAVTQSRAQINKLIKIKNSSKVCNYLAPLLTTAVAVPTLNKNSVTVKNLVLRAGLRG